MNDCGISKLDLKRRNRMQILRVVREQGPISRVDISAILQITRAAVTIITNEMIDQHILEEIGEEPIVPGMEIRKGRRKILLDINETFKFAFGVYIDEKEVSIGMTTLNSAALDKRTFPHDGNLTLDEVVDLMESTIHTMLVDSCLTTENVLAIGIGVMPSMYEAMQSEISPNGDIVFPTMKERLEARYEEEPVSIYTGNAILEFAMAGIHYRESHAKSENQVFVYLQDGHYCAIPLHGAAPMHEGTRPADFIEHLCVNPNGRALEGYPNGSACAELSVAAMQEQVQPVFSQEQTPKLYELVDGDITRLSLSVLLTAAESDEVLRPTTDALMMKFMALLHSLHCLYFAEHICLYGFGFTDAHLNAIRGYALQYAGVKFAETIMLSPIQERFHFLCGCTYAIQRGFYVRGGLA